MPGLNYYAFEKTFSKVSCFPPKLEHHYEPCDLVGIGNIISIVFYRRPQKAVFKLSFQIFPKRICCMFIGLEVKVERF